jgi:hypothetical protein
MKAIGAALLVVTWAARAHAFGAGISGYSGSPPAHVCTECHSGGAAPMMVAISGSPNIGINQTLTYTLNIVTGASSARVGFDIATSAGTLAIVLGQATATQLLSGEITHTTNWPQGGTVQLQFNLTAPSSNGLLTLFVNVLRSDGVDDPGGDGMAGNTLAVTVGVPVDLAGVDANPGAPPMPSSPQNEPHWACDGSAASLRAYLGWDALLVPLALLALAARRFRRR